MINKYTQIDPHDALYTSVMKTLGGVEELAVFLTNRRGIAIDPETLRQKMRRVKSQSMSLDMCELATEWMMEKQGGADYAQDWLLVLNLRQGVDATILPPAPQHANEMDAAKQKVMEMSQLNASLPLWPLYLRTWRPGRPHPKTWPALYAQAMARWRSDHARIHATNMGLRRRRGGSFYLRGRSAGREDEGQEGNDRINEQAARARREVRNVENEVASMDAVSDRLKSDWVRRSSSSGC